MKGMLKLAFKLLVNDKTKFSALLIGIAFAVLLMMFVTSMFGGVMTHSSATVINIGAPMWVLDPAVQTPVNSVGLPDYVLAEVRSMRGVKYAVPLYSGAALVRLRDGTYQAVTVIGLDDTSLLGRPQLSAGKIENIYAENGFIAVDDADFAKLGSPRIGSEFELNDHRGVIVGIANVSMSTLFGLPTLYTTYERAIQYIPNPRYTISYVLVEPRSESDITAIKRQVEALGYLALTRDEFIQRTMHFYIFQSGFGMNLLVMTATAFIVGLAVTGQTFYTFILENLEKFGALKAIGAKGYELIFMILFQASFAAMTGYGLGVGFCTAAIGIAKWARPEYAAIIRYQNLAYPFILVLLITALSSYVGVRKVLRIEPFDIFRG